MSGEWFREAFGAHYPVLYRHRDEAEAARCLDLLPQLVTFPDPDLGPVLDLGCGDGRHLAMLGRQGVEAVGLDLSAPLLIAARGRDGLDGSFPLVRADMRSLPLQSHSFGAVLSLFTAFGYFSSDEDNQLPVNQISRVLAPGGHWFLDYLDGDAVRREMGGGPPPPRSREVGPLVVEESRGLSADGKRVVKDVVLTAREGRAEEAAGIGVASEGLRYRESVALFTLDELDAMADRAGLHRVASAGGYEGQELGTGSRWILVFHKAAEDKKPEREGT